MIITDQARAQAIAQTFCDEYSKKIILCTNSGSKSIEEISEIAGIPKSTCYRRIGKLLDAGFIRSVKTDSAGYSTEHDCYRSVFSKLEIRIVNGSLTVEIDPEASPNPEMPLLVAPQVRAT